MGASRVMESCSVLFLESWLARGYGKKTPLLLEIASELYEQGFSIFDFGGNYREGELKVLISQDIVFVRRDSELGKLLDTKYHERGPSQ